MMLWIFVTCFALVIALLFFSYFYDSIQQTPIPFIKLFGWAFLFIIAVSCAVSGIEYTSGSTINDTNGTITVTDNYTTYSNTTLFVLLAIMSALAFGMILYYTSGV